MEGGHFTQLAVIVIFYKYIDAQVAVNVVKGSLMRPQEFISMIKDCKLVSGALTNDILMNIFISLNRPFGIPSPFLCFAQFKEVNPHKS